MRNPILASLSYRVKSMSFAPRSDDKERLSQGRQRARLRFQPRLAGPRRRHRLVEDDAAVESRRQLFASWVAIDSINRRS